MLAINVFYVMRLRCGLDCAKSFVLFVCRLSAAGVKHAAAWAYARTEDSL